MAKVSRKVSESLSEYLILPGKVICPPEKVSLHAQIGDISLQYPFMTARMQSVVGPEMAVAAGRNIHQKPLEQAIRLANAVSAITLDGKNVEYAMKIYEG